MEGIENFIYTESLQKQYLKKISDLIFYCYNKLIEGEKKYSISDIKKKMIALGHNPKKLPLEDYLTYDFVNNQLVPNRRSFQLDYTSITPQVGETDSNIEIGKIDIKYTDLEHDSYLAMECKRLDGNSMKTSLYVSQGVKRFASKQYYPEVDQSYAGMIGYLEKPGLDPHLISSKINQILKSHKDISTSKFLTLNTTFPNSYFDSAHCINNRHIINIGHFWLDYSSLIVE